MKKLFLFLLFCLAGPLAYANLTVGQVPVTKTGGSSPTLQNGSITDTGTASGAGNVGINSTAPGQRLDVQGTLRATAIQAGTGAAVLTGDSNGNIGLGQASPAETLDVNGTVKATGIELPSGVPGVTTNKLYNNSGTLNFNGAAIGGGLWTTVNTNDVTEINGSTYGNVGIGTSASTTASLVILKNGSQPYIQVNSSAGGAGNAFIITNAGNVGIAKTNPGQALDVLGTVQSSLGFIANGSGASTFNTNVGISNASPGQALDVTGTVRSTSFLQTGSVVNSFNGNVGIGTTIPQQNLYVVSKIVATGNISIGSGIPAATLDVVGTVRITNVGSSNKAACWCTDGKTLGASTGGTYPAATCQVNAVAC